MLVKIEKYFKWKSGFLPGTRTLLVTFLLFSSSHLIAGEGGEHYRSGILASLSLITKYHRAIIWAIFHLKKCQSIHYQQDWYYQMLVRKPARPEEQTKTDDFTNESPLADISSAGVGVLDLSFFQQPAALQRQATPPTSLSLLPQPQNEESLMETDGKTPEVILSDTFSQMIVSPEEPGGMPVFPLPDAQAFQPRLSQPIAVMPPVLPALPISLSWIHQRMPQWEEVEKAQAKAKAKALKAQKKRQTQLAEGRDFDLKFFVSMEGAFQYRDPEEGSDRSDTPDTSSGTPFGSPHQIFSESPKTQVSPQSPHKLASGRRTSLLKKDGYFIYDSCVHENTSYLPNYNRFGMEFRKAQKDESDFTALGREARDWDFLAIKFRVLKEQPTYKFGLRDGMICNVYEHVRQLKKGSEHHWIELCAPYIEAPEASLYQMHQDIFQSIHNDRMKEDPRLQHEEAQIMDLIRRFEMAASGPDAKMFIEKGQDVHLPTDSEEHHTVKCIGHGQCATVWRLGEYQLAARRYGRHTYNSAVEQAAVQQASNTIHEQLANAGDPRIGGLKLVEDIGLPRPMSLLSTRVLSRFLILPSQDGYFALYEIQPLIPRDELVEQFLTEFAQIASTNPSAATLPRFVPLYSAKGDAKRTGATAVASFGNIWTLIITKILEQLITVSRNLEKFTESHDMEQVLGIGIDSKIANYQVRFADVSEQGKDCQLRAFLANFDGYPPNLTLFNKETVLFKGGPLYDLLNEYFEGFGFTKEFITRSMSLTTLEKQALKMLVSVANETAKYDPDGNVLNFTLDIVNRWLKEQRSMDKDVTTWTMEDVAMYQKKSGRYHRAVRLHLLAAELGSKVNPRIFGVSSIDFPVSDDQADWLRQIRARFSTHIMVFFHLNEIDKLEQFLLTLLDYDFNAPPAERDRKLAKLPDDVIKIARAAQTLLETGGMVFQEVVQEGDVETIVELMSDVFDRQYTGIHDRLLSGAQALPAKLSRCQHTGSCSHSQREHALFHLWIEHFFLHQSFPVMGISAEEHADLVTRHVSRSELDVLMQNHDLGLRVTSEHHSRRSLLASLLRIPEARLLAGYRNALQRLQRMRGKSRQSNNEERVNRLLQELSEVLQTGERDPNRNILLLNSLLLDRAFIILETDPQEPNRFVIRQYEMTLELQQEDDPGLMLNSRILAEADLRGVVSQMLAGEVAPHYFIFRGSAAGEWYILRPQESHEQEESVTDPDDHPSDLFLGLVGEMKRYPNKAATSNMSPARLRAYREAISNFLQQHAYERLPNPPNDQHCLFHALTVILGLKGNTLTKAWLMQKLRIFLAKLLLKVNLGSHHENGLTEPELMLINQIGPVTLVDMLDELSVTSEALLGPYHRQGRAVWADYNMILIAAVAFGINIPFTFFDLHNPGGHCHNVLEHNTATSNGTMSVLDMNQQPPPVMIIFGEHANHWEVVVQSSFMSLVTPHVPWMPTPLLSQTLSASDNADMFVIDDLPDTTMSELPVLTTSDLMTIVQNDLQSENEGDLFFPSVQDNHYPWGVDPGVVFMDSQEAEQSMPGGTISGLWQEPPANQSGIPEPDPNGSPLRALINTVTSSWK